MSASLVKRAATALYRLLLVSYPRAFRLEHGAEAASLFGEACQDDWSGGRVGGLARRLMAACATVPRDGWVERRIQRRSTRAESPVSGGFVAPGLVGDLKYAIRSIRGRPLLSATIAGTLAIGIGTNTAVFSIIDATLIRPTPYVDARRVVLLEAVPTSGRRMDPTLPWARTWAA